MVKEIIKDYDALSKRSVEYAVKPNEEEINQIITDLKDTIEANNLIYLAAPQIGYNRRLYTIKFDDGYHTFINPMITHVKDQELMREYCISLEKEYIIPRHKEILMVYQSPTGTNESNKFLFPVAPIIEQCQEIVDGVLPCDYGLEVTEEFDATSDEEKEEVIRWYLSNLSELLDKLNKDIETDDALRETRDAINFMESVVRGETKIAPLREPEKVKLNRKTRRLIDKLTRKKR